MARVVAITPEVLVKLSKNREFCRKKPSLCNAIKAAPGQAYKCCDTMQETIAARQYWEGLKRQVLKLKKSEVNFIKTYLKADQIFVSYIDENNKAAYRVL